MARRWISLVRSLGEALVEVLNAEAAALKEEVASSGRHLAMAVALAGLAAVLVFWAMGTAAFLIYQVLTLWLSGWLSTLIVLGLLLLLALGIAALARRRLQSIESPATTVRRRIADHQQWWQERLLEDPDDSAAASLSGGDSSKKPELTNES